MKSRSRTFLILPEELLVGLEHGVEAGHAAYEVQGVYPVQYSTVQYSTVQYSTVQYSKYSTVQYSTVQYSTVQ